MLLVPLLALGSTALAHMGHHHAHHHNIAKRATAAPTDEASEAKISGATDECTAYNDPIVSSLAKSYPANWEIASIPDSDTDAQALFKALQPNIPNIKVKGTPQGDFSAFTPTYDSSDPDCWWTYKQCTSGKTKGVIGDLTTCNEVNLSSLRTLGALTYDDGPNCSHNAFYDYLREQNQKATMFFIGSNVMNWPYQAQRALVDGHEICVHTWSHRYMTGLTNEQAFAELYYTQKIIKEVIGVTPKCWRPAFGDVDDRIRFIAQSLGLQTITWVRDIFDWNWPVLGLKQIDANYQGLIDAAANGTFSTYGRSPGCPKVQSAFKAVVPVGVCHNVTHPYMEDEYEYPDFKAYVAGTTQLSLPGVTETPVAKLDLPLSAGNSNPITNALYTPDSGAATGAASSPQQTSSSSSSSTSSSKTTGAQSAAKSGSNSAAADHSSAQAFGPMMLGSLAAAFVAVGAAIVAI
ncbi:carbohydrate esterase family 4 protein [Atractiella rhizophila]|nr:carbohydrate esterase family 4 protein [Atractiella rhizophila]